MIELNRSSKTKTRKAFISIALVLALAITGALAFLTARDSAENKFTVGNVDIDLTEPSWNENAAKNIVSGQVIAKDPTITNTGRNDAYVYMMVEIPKAIETDIVSTDESGNEVTTTEANYPLFSFAANEGWTLIDSQVGTDIDAYDYYVYGYNTALTPGNAATLFNEVAFANVTSDFVNPYADEGKDLSLDINVTGYAIQSDYYNNEATDATTAWSLYINQNDWTWPNKKYAGLSTLSFVAESGEVVHTEAAAAGTPVEMYFEPSLAKDGYTFDWVDETTSEVAYSGMPMPEEDTTLTASYTATGYSAEASDYLKYNIELDADGNPYGILVGADTASASYPTELTTVVVPNSIEVTKTEAGDYTSPDAAYVVPAGSVGSNIPTGTFTLPITAVKTIPGSGLYDIMETLVIGDSVTNVETLDRSGSGSRITENSICKNVILPYGIKQIGNQTFYNFTALESIDLPNSLTYMGDAAFEKCSALTTIDMPKGVEFCQANGMQFMNCVSLTSATFNSDVPNNCFRGCTGLTDVSIGNRVTRIGDSAFYNCTALTSVTIPDSVTSIGDSAFYRCTGLTSVTIPDSVTSIGARAFESCAGLTSVTIGNGVMSIGKQAFFNCNGLTSITIPNSVTSIGYGAFYRCTGLTSVTIGNGVTSIGEKAFYSCTGLTSITVDVNNPNYSSDEYGVLFNKDKTELIQYPIGNERTEYIVPDSVTSIVDDAFYNCTNLATASVPSSCTVGTSSFPSTCTVTYR